MGALSRLREGRVALALVLLLAGAAALVWFLRGPATPAYEMELHGSRWVIASISGGPALEDPLPEIAFGQREDVTLRTGCRTLAGTFSLDTDGDYLVIWFDVPADATCPEQEDALLDALRGVEHWSIVNDKQITFHGVSELTLRR